MHSWIEGPPIKSYSITFCQQQVYTWPIFLSLSKDECWNINVMTTQGPFSWVCLFFRFCKIWFLPRNTCCVTSLPMPKSAWWRVTLSALLCSPASLQWTLMSWNTRSSTQRWVISIEHFDFLNCELHSNATVRTLTLKETILWVQTCCLALAHLF